MSQSTPTIYDVIIKIATLYKTSKGVAPTHVFVSPYNYKKLKLEMAYKYGQMQDILMTDPEYIHSEVGELVLAAVGEDNNDFLLIGRESDYLDYVMERTVL